MARFNRRFEVKREMNDGGKIRPDDSNVNSQRNVDYELLEELQKVGFDDDVEIQQENFELKIDENNNPIIAILYMFL